MTDVERHGDQQETQSEHWAAADKGEVTSFIQPDGDAEAAAPRAHLTTGELLQFEPMNPVEIQFAIQEIQAALTRYAQVYPHLVEARYKAENAYVKAKSLARVNAPSGGYAADRGAYADLESIDELEAFQTAKTNQYAADALEKSLRARLFGYLNMNNNMASLYNSSQHSE